MSSTDSSAEKRITGTSERREQIIQRLRAQGSVQVNDLSHLYGVSTVTIRNDLAFLEKQGIAVRAYGGALICEGMPGAEPSVEDKSSLNTAVKRSIAQAAAALVKPGHRIILDSGTTTYEIARMLRQHTDVIAMTNGMNVANALLEAEGVELLMTGGHLRRQSQSFYGDQAEQSYRITILTCCSWALTPSISIAA
jgi:DeoR family transcriptional regulator of aga operon